MKLSFTDICPMQKMMMLFMAASFFCSFPGQAQQKNRAEKNTAAKTMSPVFKSTLGNVLSNTVPASVMKSLLDSSLHARDKKGALHPVVAFRFGYQTHNTFLNDTTGKSQTAPSYFSFQFYNNRLDSIWRKRVGEQLKSGDELFFDRIVAKDPKGVQYLASPLHFVVQ